MAGPVHAPIISVGGIANKPVTKYVRSFNNNTGAGYDPRNNDFESGNDSSPLFTIEGLDKLIPSITGPTSNVTNNRDSITLYLLIATLIIVVVWREG